MYFVYLYENRTVKPVDIVFKKEMKEDEGERWEG
jgi:hypothetical protein